MSGSRSAPVPPGPPAPPPPPGGGPKLTYKEKQKTAIAVRKVRWEEEFPIHFLAMAGDTAALERTIPLCDPPSFLGQRRSNQPDHDTWTPGHYASFYGHAAFLDALILRGASPQAENLNKCTLLHFAAGRGNLECVRVLLESGANPNANDDDRMTPFLRCEELKPEGWETISRVLRIFFERAVSAVVAAMFPHTRHHLDLVTSTDGTQASLLKQGGNLFAALGTNVELALLRGFDLKKTPGLFSDGPGPAREACALKLAHHGPSHTICSDGEHNIAIAAVCTKNMEP